MIISHNLLAMNANRNAENNSKTMSTSYQKLGSGYRINKAADDVAGLTISESMRGQIRGLDTASSNVQNGLNMFQVAEGGMNEIHSILHRMRELAVQCVNDTITDEDRDTVQKEIKQLNDGIQSIARETEFNTIEVLGGGEFVVEQPPISTNIYKSVYNLNSTNMSSFFSNVAIWNNNTADGINFMIGNLPEISFGSFYGTPQTTTAKRLDHYIIDVMPNFQNFLRTQMYDDYSNPSTLRLDSAKTFANVLSEAFNKGIDDVNNMNTSVTYPYLQGIVDVDPVGNVSFSLVSLDGSSLWFDGCSPLPSNSLGHDFFHVNCSSVSDFRKVEQNSFWIQSGANMEQAQNYSIRTMKTESIGIRGASVKTIKRAEELLERCDSAIEFVSNERANIGSIVNRLEHQNTNAQNGSENLQSSESIIRDTNMASEITSLSRSRILLQASQAMITQANSLPQGVLKLLQ